MQPYGLDDKRIRDLVGLESEHEAVVRVLRDYVENMHAGVIGALLVTCAEDTGQQCALTFQRNFARYLLPSMKHNDRHAIRVSNLGGRYEWGTIRLVEEHFATPLSQSSFKVIVVKINAHVFGDWTRDGKGVDDGPLESENRSFFGGLQGLMAGINLPSLKDLREAFGSGGKNRLDDLANCRDMDPAQRDLFVGIANAGLQAQRAVTDIHDLTPKSPTVFLVAPSVTLTRPARESQLLCGFYQIDRRDGRNETTYMGLGDDPTQYRVKFDLGRMRVVDEELTRSKEDKEVVVVVEDEDAPVEVRPIDAPPAGIAGLTRAEWAKLLGDKRVRKFLARLNTDNLIDNDYARAMLKILLRVLMQTSPAVGMMMMVRGGVSDLHDLFRPGVVKETVQQDAECRAALRELQQRVDQLPPDKAREVIEMLVREARKEEALI